ncbi:MAG: META domain-containing protein [Paracoccaceae bacterium]|jgi:putative lipoprotein
MPYVFRPLARLLAPLACLTGLAALPLAAQDHGLAALEIGVNWQVTELEGAPLPPGLTASLTRPEPGRIAGHSGCNRFTGTISEQGGALSIGPLASTRMACPPAQMALEQRMLAALAQLRGADIRDGMLVLTGEAGTLLRAHRQP